MRPEWGLQRTAEYAGVIAVLIAAMPTACTPPAGSRDRQSSRPWLQARQHWVQDVELREIMAGLVREQTWPNRDQDVEATDPQTRRKALADAARLAEALARAGEDIPELVADQDMSEADRRVFAEQATTLHDQALKLKDAADRGNLERMQQLLDAIDATCGSCHDRFRDFSGLLGPRQATLRPLDQRARRHPSG